MGSVCDAIIDQVLTACGAFDITILQDHPCALIFDALGALISDTPPPCDVAPCEIISDPPPVPDLCALLGGCGVPPISDPCETACEPPPPPGIETLGGIDASDESLEDYILDLATSIAGTKPLVIPTLPGSGAENLDPPVAIPVDGEVCWGQSQRPHESKHNPGKVAAVGRTYCPSPKPFMKVKSTLKLLYGGHLRDVDTDSSTNQYRNRDGWYEVRVRLLYDCPSWDATFAIFSEHWVTFNSGNSGYTDTANSNKETIDCGLLTAESQPTAKTPIL